MFERFTERARQVIVLAQDEALALKHNYIGTEHILLGMLRESEGLGALVLAECGITVEEVRKQVARIVGQGDEAVTRGQIPFTPRAKKVISRAPELALGWGHNYVGTEHLLLSLVQEGEGVSARILLDADVDVQEISALIEDKALDGFSTGVAGFKKPDTDLTVTSGPRYREARHLQQQLGPLVKASGNPELIKALQDLTALACTPFSASGRKAG